jgi:hypothetical protein
LRLWNFLLTEEERLHQARRAGHHIVGAMKDLGTVPVMVFSLPNCVAFYPDGAWWIPCLMQNSDGLLKIADNLGISEMFCPVRAMLGAFTQGGHFPLPDLLTCSVGAVCDDFSAIAQRLESLGHSILWWEMPRRRTPNPDEPAVALPGGQSAPVSQVACVQSELQRIREAWEKLTGTTLDDDRLAQGIDMANRVRAVLDALRTTVYQAPAAPVPALEMLIAEMLAIHFCSDRAESLADLQELLDLAHTRLAANQDCGPADAARIFWVNPVADLRVMNELECAGGRLAGTDFLFFHALDPIPTEIPPMEALARTALADPMTGSAQQRAERIVREIHRMGAEGLVVSRIPGASHCASEGAVIRDIVQNQLDIPTLELEVPPMSDSLAPGLRTRLEALVETVRRRRKS